MLISGCSTVPTSMHDKKAASYVPKITEADFTYDPMETAIAGVYAEPLKNKEISGASMIEDGLAAFLIRASFARMAEKSIDLQTYIYSNDFSSRILIEELRKAAERGVKVRILLDDNGTDSDIVDVMLLNLHPNVEVKVFNVFKYRSKLARYPQFLFDFNRLNSRMHNKLFVVDNVAVIIGGRNVGSNYFYPETDANFSDTDVLFLGKIAHEASKSFNEYWNHPLAISASFFPDNRSKKRIKKLREQFARLEETNKEEAERYNGVLDYAVKAYKDKKFPFYWGKGQIIADPPSKIGLSIREKKENISPIVTALGYLWKHTHKDIHISAAYFVPGKEGMEQLIQEKKKDVDITIVTNSLSSTDAGVVYAKWEKYRTPLIENGVTVYEFMNSAIKQRAAMEKTEKEHKKKLSSFSALHSKTIVFDDSISWIGSFNLDPRSAYFNTEIVAVFENKEFNAALKKMINDDKDTAWHVTREDGKTVWTGKRPEDASQTIHYKSPDTSFFKRLLTFLMKIVPESLV